MQNRTKESSEGGRFLSESGAALRESGTREGGGGIRIRLALLGVLFTLNEVIKMEKMIRRKTPGAAKLSRYHSLHSIGELLGVRSPALKGMAKMEFLPKWKRYVQTDAVLSKRSLLVDIGMSDIQMDDVISTVDLLDKFREGSDTRRATYSLSG